MIRVGIFGATGYTGVELVKILVRHPEAQIAFVLKQAEEGTAIAEVCRKSGISEATFYAWRRKYAGLLPSEMKRLRQLEEENGKLKRIVADLSLDKEMLQDVIRRADLFESHQVSKETLTLREKMGQVLEKLQGRDFVPFVSLFTMEEGRLGVVVTFMAILEMVKEGVLSLVQTESFGPIHVKARVQEAEGDGYDLAELERRFPGGPQGFETPAPGHYHFGKKSGDLTHYGEGALLLLQSLAERGRFEAADFGSRFVALFDSSSYQGYRDLLNKVPEETRVKLIAAPAAAAAGGELRSWLNPKGRGPNGEALYLDTARFGPADAENMLVLIAGTHVGCRKPGAARLHSPDRGRGAEPHAARGQDHRHPRGPRHEDRPHRRPLPDRQPLRGLLQ